MSSTKETADKLELADKEAIDAELQVGALKRRLALLEEEAARNKAKLQVSFVKQTLNQSQCHDIQENIEKCNDAESSAAKNEEGRRAGEARSFAAEQGLEAMESELEEAQSIATAANHKFEDAQRKCKVVEGDLERIIERAEEFEGKARDLETQVREMEGKVKETEAITVKVNTIIINSDTFRTIFFFKTFFVHFQNAEEEDKFENKISRLQEEFKLADTRAEFAERSVDKLEATIDGLLESLMNEKLNYRNISEKLDKTLNDMMSMQ